MGFLTRDFRKFTPGWFVQRSLIVIKERRLPQLGIKFGNKEYNEPEEELIYEIPPIAPEPVIYNLPVPELSFLEVNGMDMQGTSNPLNDYFDCIYLLNLKHRSDKRLVSIFQFKKLGINAKIVDAVNGSKSPYREEYEKYKAIPLGGPTVHLLEKKYNRKMISSPGAWGALISKKMIFQDAIKKNYKRILILQDDLFYIKDFFKKFTDFIEKIDDDWKIIGLGATQHSWKVPNCLFYKDPSLKEYSATQDFYYPLKTDGAFALAYDSSVFQFIIDEIDKMNCSFDSGAVRAVYRKFRKKCFVAQPNLIIADVSTSDIRGGRDQEKFSLKMKWDLKLYDRQKYNEMVSVIMPAYNAELTIEKSIRSVLMQTYDNLELIVVDDGSTDETEKIVRELAMQDKRIIYHRNEQNRGCYFVRNDALRLSKGKYIAVQDADDISLRTRLEKQLIPIVSGNAMVSFSMFLRSRCRIDELDLKDQAAMMKLVNSRRVMENGKYPYHDRPNLALATSLYEREVFEKYGLFWESRFSGDAEFLERLFFHELGLSFQNHDFNVHTYISKEKQRKGAFVLLDEILYISAEMDATNLSNTFEIKGDERREFAEKYRKRLTGESDYQYPIF